MPNVQPSSVFDNRKGAGATIAISMHTLPRRIFSNLERTLVQSDHLVLDDTSSDLPLIDI